MKRRGDIEGVLEAWFLDGPLEMPDRLFDAVFDQVERVPQRRLARLRLRFSDMSSTARLAAAGAAAVLVVGFGFAVLGRSPEAVPGASPPPSGTPSASPSSELSQGVPAQLAYAFLGPNRTVAGIPPGDRSIIDLYGGDFVYSSGQGNYLRSDVAGAGNELVLTLQNALGECAEGEVGRYTWSTSPGGSTLQFEAVTDSCQPRLEALPGAWQRAACRDPQNSCLGPVEAGSYASMYVTPALAADAEWQADFGALRYTVPDGWANSADWPDHYALMRAGAYSAGETGDGPVAPDTITLLVRPGAARLHSECSEENEPGVGGTRADLEAWILAHPGLVATRQPDVSIDGNPATVLDLAVADYWIETCDETAPFVAAPVFFSGYHWALAKNDLMRVVLVDLPAGTTAAIAIDVESPSTFDALVAEAMPIVESFDFK